MRFTLNVVPPVEGVGKLRTLYETIEIHSRNLSTFDVNAEHYGPSLISIMVSKLPDELRLDISRQMPAGKWKLQRLLGIFISELCASLSSSKYHCRNEQKYCGDFMASNLFVGRHCESGVSSSYCKGGHPSNK